MLWVNLSLLPEAVIAPIPQLSNGDASVVEGERVFTIGSPRSSRKIFTSGIVSKVETRAIISDIQIDHGNSGGPLFNSQGVVAGITTFRNGRLSGIVRIEEVSALLAEARAKMLTAPPPKAVLLPVEPIDTFPLDAIKKALGEGKLDQHPYVFEEGNYDVAIVTPILKYFLEEGSTMQAARQKESRTRRREEAVRGTFRPLEDLKNWAEYVGEYQPTLQIEVSPKLRETFGSAFSRGLAANYGSYMGPATMRFKTDFYKMRLICGEKEVEPILPAKIASVVNINNPFVRVTDATYEGLYQYASNAISPECGQVALELYSEEHPDKPEVKILSDKTVERVWADFEPYRTPHGIASSSGGASSNLITLPSVLSFGTVPVNQSRTLSATLTNLGPKPQTRIQIGIKATADSFGLAESSCGKTLAPSGSCTLTISFKPTFDGHQDGSIAITSGENENAAVGLSGSGTEVTLSPSSLNFGDISRGTSVFKQVKITNHSTLPVTFNVSTVDSKVFQASDGCNLSIPAHSSCALTITFTPSSVGPTGRTLTIKTSDLGSPSLTVSMKGNGTPPSK